MKRRRKATSNQLAPERRETFEIPSALRRLVLTGASNLYVQVEAHALVKAINQDLGFICLLVDCIQIEFVNWESFVVRNIKSKLLECSHDFNKRSVFRHVILHAAKNEAGLNCWKLWVMSDWSFSRCLLEMFSRLPSMALQKSANVL